MNIITGAIIGFFGGLINGIFLNGNWVTLFLIIILCVEIVYLDDLLEKNRYVLPENKEEVNK